MCSWRGWLAAATVGQGKYADLQAVYDSSPWYVVHASARILLLAACVHLLSVTLCHVKLGVRHM